jgi:gliding motility-associated lipoprotein GldH
MNPRIQLIFTIAAFLFFMNCDNSSIYRQNFKVSDEAWNTDELMVFSPNIIDTVNGFDIYFTIRHTDDYPFRNIILFVTITSPDNQEVTDTINVLLADDIGKWRGSGLGDIYDLSVLYKQNVRFPLQGKYTFEVIHGMRKDPLPGVIDVGLNIKRFVKKRN